MSARGVREGRRYVGTSQRALGANPRARGTNPRALGENPKPAKAESHERRRVRRSTEPTGVAGCLTCEGTGWASSDDGETYSVRPCVCRQTT